MPALDTNSLVRYLTQDDPIQYPLAKKFIENSSRQQRLFVPTTVILETEWVLRSRYKFDKAKVCLAISQLIDSKLLDIENVHAVAVSVWLYQQNQADFADCLHTAISQFFDESPMVTFDKNASEIANNQLLDKHFLL